MIRKNQDKQMLVKEIKDHEKLLKHFEQVLMLLRLQIENKSVIKLGLLAYWLSPVKGKLYLFGLFLFIGGVSGFASFAVLFSLGVIGVISAVFISIVVGLLSGCFVVGRILLSDTRLQSDTQLLQKIDKYERVIRHLAWKIDELKDERECYGC